MASYGKGEPALIEVNGKHIKEFPISTRDIHGHHLIYSGGGYFRLFPYWLINKWANEDSDYLLSYIHPRDLDYGQPMIKELPLSRKFKSYIGLKGAENKLRRLLSDFDFTDLSNAVSIYDWSKVKMIKL